MYNLRSSLRTTLIFFPSCRRLFQILSTCDRCGAQLAEESPLLCGAPNCGALQETLKQSESEAEFHSKLFRMFQIPSYCFRLDLTQLDQRYKRLQTQLHPDKFALESEEQQARSAAASTAVNQFYQRLRLPASRAELMLMNHFGIRNLGEDSDSEVNDMALMTEVFELREEIEDALSDEALKAVDVELRRLSDEAEIAFEDALSNKDRKRAIETGARISYYHKMRSEVYEKTEV